MFFDDPYSSNEETFGGKAKKYLKKILFESTAGRVIMEAGRMATVAVVCYIIFSWIGEILIFLIKTIKFIIAHY